MVPKKYTQIHMRIEQTEDDNRKNKIVIKHETGKTDGKRNTNLQVHDATSTQRYRQKYRTGHFENFDFTMMVQVTR